MDRFKVNSRFASENSKCLEYCDDCFRCFEPKEAYHVVYLSEAGKGKGRPLQHRVCDGCHSEFVVSFPEEHKMLDYQSI